MKSSSPLPTVSIVVPVRDKDDYFFECIEGIKRLDYSGEIEVIAVVEQGFSFEDQFVQIIESKSKSPSVKRNLGVAKSAGEVVAFLDSDAYPAAEWLTFAVHHLLEQPRSAVCGPMLSVPTNNVYERPVSAILDSLLGSGPLRFRFVPLPARNVDDFPSCNFVMWRSVFDAVDGFDHRYFPGEDTKLCLDITSKINGSIFYHPNVRVFHYRRPLFLPYLKQTYSYGSMRGFFSVIYPRTSRRVIYYFPSTFLIVIAILLTNSHLNKLIRLKAMCLCMLYMLLLVGFSVKLRRSSSLLLLVAAFLETHIGYGVGFVVGVIRGLFANLVNRPIKRNEHTSVGYTSLFQ